MIVSEPIPQWARNRINELEEDAEKQKIITNKIIKRKKKLERAIIDIKNVLLTHKGSPVEKINEIERIINKIKWVDIDNTPH